MKDLHKHFLDFEKTFPYVQDALEGANTLSSELLKSVKFAEGHFFTLLPEDANLERLYEFKEGVILPQNPLIKHEDSNCFYSITPNVRKKLSSLIWKKIISSDRWVPIFDDILAEVPRKSVQQALALYYEKEVYYTMPRSNTSEELVNSCLWASNAFWHSLCVLTKLDIESIEDGRLYLDDIVEICLNVELAFIGAYDGEGYIFWEKQNGFFP